MSKIDLHIHTSYSNDGEFAPEEIAAQCQAQDMNLIAITDHNSVRGALQDSDWPSMRILSGIEMDCTYCNHNFHLLGYGIQHTCPEFVQIEEDIVKQEKSAAQQRIHLFRKAVNIPIHDEDILDASPDGIVPGELIAQIVLAREDAMQYEILHPYLPGGSKSDMPNVRFYWDFFAEGKEAYVPIHYLSLPDAAALIHRTGGFAVLAHPGQNLGNDRILLRKILTEKLDGIEVFSSYHSQEEAAFYLETARAHKLLVTCGSDFHGKHKPSIRLGQHGAALCDKELLSDIESYLSNRP